MFKRISGHGEGGRRSGILNTILRAGPRLRPSPSYLNLTSRQTRSSRVLSWSKSCARRLSSHLVRMFAFFNLIGSVRMIARKTHN
jgi:hypothetical protein